MLVMAIVMIIIIKLPVNGMVEIAVVLLFLRLFLHLIGLSIALVVKIAKYLLTVV